MEADPPVSKRIDAHRADREPIIDVRGLCYRYPGAAQPTLRDLAFRIGEGEILGFLGPNGSGKSTTQRVLTGVLSGWSGEIRAFGESPPRLGAEFYNRIGVSFEFPNLYEKLTAEENLKLYARFFDGPTRPPSELLRELDLPVSDRRPAGQWSKGMRMRLVLARSLLNQPRLWFLDEPTTGQDPEHAVRIRELIRNRADQGTTVFLTTHNMVVAEELCDRVAFLFDGRIVALDTPQNLRLARPRGRAHVQARSEGRLELREFDLEDANEKRAFLDFVAAHQVETIHTQEPSLEQIFLDLTGRQLAAEPSGT